MSKLNIVRIRTVACEEYCEIYHEQAKYDRGREVARGFFKLCNHDHDLNDHDQDP